MKKKFAIALSVARVTPAARPRLCREKASTREGDDRAQNQVDPTPRCGVDLEDVVRRHDEELVLEDRGQAGDGLKAADDDQDDAGEDVARDGGSAEFRRSRRSGFFTGPEDCPMSVISTPSLVR